MVKMIDLMTKRDGKLVQIEKEPYFETERYDESYDSDAEKWRHNRKVEVKQFGQVIRRTPDVDDAFIQKL